MVRDFGSAASLDLTHHFRMNTAVLATLAFTGFSVAFFHAALPTHWLPFVLVALLFGRVRPLINWLNRHALVISRVAGVLLILVGVLILTGRLGVLAGWLTSALPSFEL